MATNNYITLDGKLYKTTNRNLVSTPRKAQQINVTLTKKTASQLFSFTDQQWVVSILVEITPSLPGYGSKSDLEAAYAKNYVSFTDNFGNTADVYMVGDLPEKFDWAVVDDAQPFPVDLRLRKRQT